ncbi:acetyl-CoA C-acetyltransferase [Chryseolinea lacunae]|uniref:Acetyl-CoA C-acetyltransferase n=1 Tax=Chryseolinea lacunae TaxID=2801331 RepID=A0ABS1KYL9_9BACT|nr:acetyl-CoA C-acetyltransferase [Chryseolinea lacunae]MBL0744484.1 acetyl-CoA C-acetyltransferase [Chryseolinea lacunae]
MFNLQRKVAIVGGQRIPFVRSFREYARTSNQEMLTAAMEALVQRHNLGGKRVGDVALGAVMANPMEWNLAREVVQGTSLSAHTPAFNASRACGTSLETLGLMALKIAAGQIDSGIAAGSDTNSDLPVVAQRSLAWKLMDLNNAKTLGQRLSVLSRLRFRDFKPSYPDIVEPQTGLSMGQHTELMVKEWGISRLAQDELAFESHAKGAKAYRDGFYNDLVTPYKNVTRDTILRDDTTMAKLATLKPAFDKSSAGTLTAGNSTSFTDGAAAVLLASEDFAARNNLGIQAYVTDVEAAAVDYVNGAGLLMAPTLAVARMLQRNRLTLQDFDFYEIHEAFAGQVLCTLKAWESADYCKDELGLSAPLGNIDRNKLNVKGGSLALGHPFGATGARIVATLAKLLHEKGKGRGLISICTGGGMGVVAILEK